MSLLDRKLLRDLIALKSQALAVALVMACGLAMMVTTRSLILSLESTRDTYYREHRFADVFARLKRAPNAVREQLAAIPGVDVVFVASTDLSSFSGLNQGDAAYEALVSTVRDATLAAGKKVAGPLAWKSSRKGYAFFQGPGETTLLKSGVKLALGDSPKSESKKGIAEIEGAEK